MSLVIVGVCPTCNGIFPITNTIPLTFIGGNINVKCPNNCPETIFAPPVFDINGLTYNPPVPVAPE